MRNLKRALSLTLASVMLLGMMVVGTSAASYPDVDAEDNVEAIEVVQAVGVMVGDEQGNFNPGTQVTRNEMAVIMAKLILGPDLAETYVGICPFWDVPDWAQKYVAACYDNGIVAGIGGGAYGGDQTVTAEQAAAMMLRALGYSKLSDGADDWARPVVAMASQIQLFNGVGTNPKEVLNRNQIAQLTLNTLESGMVTVQDNTLSIVGGSGDNSFTITGGGQVSYVYITSKSTYADAIDDVAASSIGSQNDGYIVELGEKLYNGSLKKYGDKTQDPSTEADPMGRPAVRWVFENKEIGTYVKGDDLKFSFTAKAAKGDMYSQIGSSVAEALRNGDTSKYTLEVWVDGIELYNPSAANYFEKNSSAAAGTKTFAHSPSFDQSGNYEGASTGYAGQSGNGVLTEVFVVDGKGSNPDDVIIIMTNTYLVKATSDYNSSTELVNVERVDINTDDPDDYPISYPPIKTTISSDDFDVVNVKEGDYLLVTWSYADNAYATVKPAELLTGTVSEYTVSENVVIDGTKYSYNKLVGVDERSDEYSINQDAKVVLDQYGYIIFVDEAISTNSFVYIQDVAGATGLSKTAIAAAYFGDGTFAEIELKKVVKKNIDGTTTEYTAGSDLSNDSRVHGWYTYIKDSDGKYVLTAADNNAGRTSDSVYASLISVAGDPVQIAFNNKVRFLNQTPDVYTDNSKVGVRANANTVFMVLDNDEELTVGVGVANAPDVFIGVDGTTITVTANRPEINWVVKDGYAQYVFIDVSKVKSSVDGAENAADYLFILKNTNNKTVVDGDTYYKFKVVIDGEETERYIEESSVAAVGELRYNVKTNSKDYITKASPFGGKATQIATKMEGSTITQKGSTITIAGTTYIIGKDTELNMVIGKNVTDLLFDKGADYELYQNTTAGTIAGVTGQLPADKGVTGMAYAVVDETGSEVLEVLWVYISSVEGKQAAVESGSNSGDINDALEDENNSGATVPGANLSSGTVTVPADKTLTLTDNITGGSGTVVAGNENASVVVKDANVSDTLGITASGEGSTVTVDGTTLDGALTITASGKDSAVAVGDTTLNETLTINATGENSSVVVKDAEVGADLTITGDVDTTLNGVNITDTGVTIAVTGDTTIEGDNDLGADGDMTITGDATINGTIALGGSSTLTITGDITAGNDGEITGSNGATLVVENLTSAGVTALTQIAGPFFTSGGEELNPVTAGTYVYVEGWTANENLRTTGITGWMLQGNGGGNVGGQDEDISNLSVTPTTVTLTDGGNFPTVTLKGDGIAEAGITGVWALVGGTIGETVADNSQYTLTFTLAAETGYQVPSSLASGDIPTISDGESNVTGTYSNGKIVYTFTVGTVVTTDYTVSVNVSGYTVGGLATQGKYAEGASVSITLTQETAADLASGTTFNVTATGIQNLQGTVTTEGKAAKDAVEDTYDEANGVDDSTDFSANEYYTNEGTSDDPDWQKATEYKDGTTYYTKTPGSEAVTAQAGVITIEFTMPAEDVAISGITEANAG